MAELYTVFNMSVHGRLQTSNNLRIGKGFYAAALVGWSREDSVRRFGFEPCRGYHPVAGIYIPATERRSRQAIFG